MRYNNGRGNIKLLLMIIIIAIFAAMGTYFVRLKINQTHIETIKTNMLLVQWKAKNYINTKKAEQKEVEYVGTKVADMLDNDLLANVLKNNVITEQDFNNYYVLKDEDLAKLEIDITNEKDSYYIVNYDSLEIIITQGCEISKDKILYKLSDISDENLNK